ncbi:hypothetical protein CDD82_5747 [Ophiocordyceps australis]|uniref:Uncharacterized protein n=1 Tax=Ophiocordyceps australis TaxID=1399860 RepID=A0A2C5YTP2_9HYPO|nr:hypothetical protein CDD82_5747 [Ophiocordyceps australis]
MNDSRPPRPIRPRRHLPQRRVQVHAMRIPQMRPANPPRRLLLHQRHLEVEGKGVQQRRAPRLHQLALDRIKAPGHEEARRVGRHVDGRANLVLHPRAFIHLDRVAGAPQRNGRRKPSNAGSNNDNLDHGGVDECCGNDTGQGKGLAHQPVFLYSWPCQLHTPTVAS